MSHENTKVVYTGDGETFEFPIPFPVDRAADVHVFLEFADGTTKRMVRNQDYTVRTSDWHVVTRVDDYRDPIAAGVKITIMRRMPIVQPSGRTVMNVSTFTNRVDSLTRMFQQLREQLDRKLHVGQNYPPFVVTTKPYPIIAADDIIHPAMGMRRGWFGNDFADGTTHTPLTITGGSLLEPIFTYELWLPEGMDHGSFGVTGGELFVPISTYEGWPLEGMEHAFAVSGGQIFNPVQAYELWPVEGTEHTFACTGGSLT